jgi:hypothetical protein
MGLWMVLFSKRFMRNKVKPHGKVNLAGQRFALFGIHRSGWNYAVKCLLPLHHPDGILLDTFIERTFLYLPNKAKPHLKPWLGIIHIPHKTPEWYFPEKSNRSLFNSTAWKESYPYCKGLFTLSAYHQQHLMKELDIPIDRLWHPTEIPEMTWSWDRFSSNPDKKIIQIGFWLRKLHSIFLLPPVPFRKVMLLKQDADVDTLMKLEFQHLPQNDLLTQEALRSVTKIQHISNRNYDIWLSENIVFLDLYDASANNTIIECMARNTPVLVNPIEPVVEYLGAEYPLYYQSLREAADKVSDSNQILSAYNYLKNHPKKYRLKGDFFLKCLIQSRIYQGI